MSRDDRREQARAKMLERALNGPDPVVGIDPYAIVDSQSRDLLRLLLIEQRETNRLLRRLAGEGDPAS